MTSAPAQARSTLAPPGPRQAPLSVSPGRRPPVSVVILTHNEEHNIRDCLLSCAWCDDVHVLDSGSKDRTVEIAREMGAAVHSNPFKSFGDQRNWAIDHIPCKNPWHFHLDADERFTGPLLEEMFERLGPDGSKSVDAAYLCPSKMMHLGRWLKGSGEYPAYQMRLFRYGACRFIDFGHGQRESAQGSVGRLVQPYVHYNFSRGMLEWFTKHNDRSTRESKEAMGKRAAGRPTLKQLFTGDAVQRRRNWKTLSYFVKGRALWRYLHMMVYRRGILDGPPGWQYCAMISTYEYWTELKIRELSRPWQEETMRLAERMMAEAGERGGGGA
jgi:glycosyltransferase involved in cell wall biosynthesis